MPNGSHRIRTKILMSSSVSFLAGSVPSPGLIYNELFCFVILLLLLVVAFKIVIHFKIFRIEIVSNKLIKQNSSRDYGCSQIVEFGALNTSWWAKLELLQARNKGGILGENTLLGQTSGMTLGSQSAPVPGFLSSSQQLTKACMNYTLLAHRMHFLLSSP